MTSQRPQLPQDSLRDSVQVSIVIPVYNDVPGLRRCLAALAEQTYPRSDFEILVVDNGSQEDIRSACTGVPNVRYLREEAVGSYAARNAGLKAARGEFLGFTDSDCIPAPDWVERAVRGLKEAEGKSVIAGRVRVFPKDPQRPTLAELYDMHFAFQQRLYVARQHYGVTANLWVPRAVFGLVGPFNAQLRSGGDYEWGRRACRFGVPLQYADDVVVQHPARREVVQLRRKVRRVVGGAFVMSRDVPSRLRLLMEQGAPPVRALRRLAANKELTAAEKLRLAGLLFVLRYEGLGELIRLMLGGVPERQ